MSIDNLTDMPIYPNITDLQCSCNSILWRTSNFVVWARNGGGIEDGDVEVRVEKDGRGEDQRDDRHRQDHPQALAHGHLQQRTKNEWRWKLLNIEVKIKIWGPWYYTTILSMH